MTGAAPPATRFDAAFSARGGGATPGLIPYITAGFPEIESLPGMLRAAEHAGVIAAEVGIPFSDPLADGPTVQKAGWHALGNGMTLARALGDIAEARAAGLTIPLAAMTYLNPVLAFGLERFAIAARESGLDGLIVPDLPDDEAGDVRDAMFGAGLALIPLVAPTTPERRLEHISRDASGFVYCVSVTGVTGAREEVPAEALALLDALRGVTPLPRALGFGLSRPAHLEVLRGRAEAAVVGSALIDAVTRSPADPAATVERFCRHMLGHE